MDQRPNVVKFPGRRRKRAPVTIGTLVASANQLPAAGVREALQEHMRAADRLMEGGGRETEITRELVLIGALTYRALFENGVPIDRNHVVGVTRDGSTPQRRRHVPQAPPDPHRRGIGWLNRFDTEQ